MGTLCGALELTMFLSVILGLAVICVAGANWQSTYGPRVVRRQPVVVVDDHRHGGHDRFSSWDDDHFDVVDDWKHGDYDRISSWDDDHFDGYRPRPVVVDDWRRGHDGFSSWDDDHFNGYRPRPVVDDWRHGHDGFSSWDDYHHDRPSHWEDRRVFRHRSRAPVRGAGRDRFPVLHGVRHRSRSGY